MNPYNNYPFSFNPTNRQTLLPISSTVQPFSLSSNISSSSSSQNTGQLTHPFQRATGKQTNTPANQAYVPLSEIRRKRKAEEAELETQRYLALKKEHLSATEVDPNIKDVLKSIGFDFDLSKKTQENARRAREAHVSMSTVHPPPTQMSTSVAPHHSSLVMPNILPPVMPPVMPPAVPMHTHFPSFIPNMPPPFLPPTQPLFPVPPPQLNLPLSGIGAQIALADQRLTQRDGSPSRSWSRTDRSRRRSHSREVHRNKSYTRETRRSHSREHDQSSRRRNFSRSPQPNPFYRRSLSPYDRHADISVDNRSRYDRPDFDDYLEARVRKPYDRGDSTVEREYRRPIYHTERVESIDRNPPRLPNRNIEREERRKSPSYESGHRQEHRVLTRDKSPFSVRLMNESSSADNRSKRRSAHDGELYDDLSDDSLDDADSAKKRKATKTSLKTKMDRDNQKDSGGETRVVRHQKLDNITEEEFKEMVVKRNGKETKMEELKERLNDLRHEEYELMRKKRKEKDGHNDPTILKNSEQQAAVAKQMDELRTKLYDMNREVRAYTRIFGYLDSQTVVQKFSKNTTIYRDVGPYLCEDCDVISKSLTDVFSHLRSTEHVKKIQKKASPWTTSTPAIEQINTAGSGDPIKGVEFLFPADAFYCELCREFFGDSKEAEKHLKGGSHHSVYEKYIAKYPAYEKVLSERKKYVLIRKAKEEVKLADRVIKTVPTAAKKQPVQLPTKATVEVKKKVATKLPPSVSTPSTMPTKPSVVTAKPAGDAAFPELKRSVLQIKVGLPRKMLRKNQATGEQSSNSADISQEKVIDNTKPALEPIVDIAPPGTDNNDSVSAPTSTTKPSEDVGKQPEPAKTSIGVIPQKIASHHGGVSSPPPLDEFLEIPLMQIGPEMPPGFTTIDEANMEDQQLLSVPEKKEDDAAINGQPTDGMDLGEFEVLDECD